jgi:RNA binding exosome subunit
MEKRLEVDIQVIIHATEDLTKVFDAFKQVFDLDKEEFTVQKLQGHFENPITMLHCKIKKKKSRNFVKVLVSNITKEEIDTIIEDLQNRCDESALYLRLSKQSLIRGKITLGDSDPIKLKIYTPIYSQKDLTKTYSEILTLGTV